METIKTKYVVINYRDDDSVRENILNAIIEWCKKHEAFSGEAIMQSDECVIDSPELLSSIVDNIISFEEIF